MAIVTWGLLDKSLVDSEKIEEAIARLIDEHNEDESAHLGEGQSLQSHKASEVIDHLVRSIVADKFSDKQMFYRSTFESLDGWEFLGDYYYHAWPGITLHAKPAPGSYSMIHTDSSGIPDFFDISKNLFFQFSASVDNSVDVKWYGVWGPDEGSWGGESAFGFLYENGVLKAIRHDGSSLYTSNIAGVDVAKPHIYRVVMDSPNKNIKYYIDGVLKATLEWETWTYSENRGPTFCVIREGANLRRLRVQEVLMARDI